MIKYERIVYCDWCGDDTDWDFDDEPEDYSAHFCSDECKSEWEKE